MVKKADTLIINRQSETFEEILILSDTRTEWRFAYFALMVLNNDIIGEMLQFLDGLGCKCLITSNDILLSKTIPIKIEGWGITLPSGKSENFIPPIKKINGVYLVDVREWCAEIWDELTQV